MKDMVIDEDTYDFGMILKKLRKERGMSQVQLANRIHKEKSIISRYENNLLSPTFDTICALARIFGVSVDYLAGIDKNMRVDFDGLTDRQISIMNDLIKVFHMKNSNKSCDYETKYKIIEQIIIEFADKWRVLC